VVGEADRRDRQLRHQAVADVDVVIPSQDQVENSIEYYDYSSAAICIIFSSNNFIDISNDIKFTSL